ncbi:X-ray repair cross-complementing protein 5 [Octopus bimaculoides]|uniref:VWFA domain-containing protein n=1 Tax=Octopus bimaculoides TaxID=37653 RepID=A0A0L8I642_OCTBM|nr:X-ray repair cross-complementing protein 5 [Octopus bimaculoides]|eukprot:XP_014790589.1 PREDICTED: X-ray repair cross-complementing protein 5-like [Octopus bimaculoides]
MAYNKTAIVIILDVSPSMCAKDLAQDSYLSQALQIIKQIVYRKVFSESKDEIAVILFGTSKTSNPLADEGDYQNICVERSLSVPDFNLLEWLVNFHPTDTTEADFVDALIVAMDHLQTNLETKKGLKHRQIILLSNLMSSFVDDQIGNIMISMKQQEITLNVISSKSTGDSNQVSDEASQFEQQKEAETIIEQMYSMVKGHNYSFHEALSRPNIFTKHHSSSAWKCNLEIGSNLSIPICGYIKLKSYKPAQSWKKVFANDQDAALKEARTLHLNDENETEIEHEDTIPGFYYGSTLVPLSEESEKYKSTKCFTVLGFTSKENVPAYSYMGDNTMYVIAEPNDQVISVAFSALVNALFETNMLAIVRRVYDARSGPRIGCLKPHIKNDYECMIYYELPFYEDILNCEFDPLPVDSCDTPKKFKPSNAQLKAMDNLIDTMTFSNEGKHKFLNTKYVSTPSLQKFYQCFEQRVLESTKPIPELPTKHGASFFENKEAVEKIKENFTLENLKPNKTEKTGEKLFGINLDMDSSQMKALTSEEAPNDAPKGDFKQLLLAGKYFKDDSHDTKKSEENAGQDKSGSQSQESSKPDQPMEGSADDLLDEM